MKKMFALTIGTFAALLAFSPLALAQDTETVRIERKMPGVGDSRTETESRSSEAYMGDMLIRQETYTESKTSEVLAVNEDGTVTKAKVTYHEVTTAGSGMDRTGQMQKYEQSAPHAGKTYLVEKTATGEVKITDEDGETPDEAELAGVAEDHDNFGEKDENPFAELIGRDLTIGEEIEFPESMLKTFGNDGKTTIENAKLKVVGTCEVDGARCVKFDMKMDMTGMTPGGPMSMKLQGELIVRVDSSWPVKLALAGPLELNAQNMKITGKMALNNTSKYSLAADDND